MKNHIIFVDDHSGSMRGQLAAAALLDSNVQRTAIREAANAEMQDTVISVIDIGMGNGVQRQVIASNPHVLKPATSWPTPGGTPLWDAIYDAILLTEEMPDKHLSDLSYLIIVTTDGRDEYSRNYSKSQLATKIAAAQATGRYTFVLRVPTGYRTTVQGLNVPNDNIREWNTTSEGMAEAATATAAATTSYFAARSAGAKSSTSFYTNAAAVNTAALTDITSEVSLYVAPAHGGRLRIDEFILSKRSKFLKGAAFVQLVKSEPKIGPKKIVLIRERNAPNRIFAGKEARQMLNLPTDPTSNARVHPGEHGNYDIFIQSESLNRLLPDNVGVVYWEKQGVPFTQADIDMFAPKAPAAPSAPVLPAVHGKTRPTPSPVPKAYPTNKVFAGDINVVDNRRVKWYAKRDDARKAGSVKDGSNLAHVPYARSGPNGERWFVYI